MAEGGDPTDDANPFSFKKFVSKKEQTSSGSDAAEDIFDLSFETTQRKREKVKKQIVVVDDGKPHVFATVVNSIGQENKQIPSVIGKDSSSSTNSKGNKKEKTDNPFSFKKFLSSSGTKKQSEGGASKVKTKVKDNLPTNNLPSDTSAAFSGIPNDLPDFVQDHYSSSIKVQYDSDIEKDTDDHSNLTLPDFTETSIVNKGHNTPTVDNDDLVVPPLEREVDDDLDFDSDNESEHIEDISRHKQGLNLPDFLSDGAVNRSRPKHRNLIIDSEQIEGQDESAVDGTDNSDALKRENIKLKEQVEKLNKERESNVERIKELEQLLVKQKKKEEEETAAMELAMGQVEQNLVDTTKRAVQAESTVSKLKQEVKTLQAEVKGQRGEKTVSADQALGEIKERTNYVAEQLSSATTSAENSLKQLLTGVDQLKLLSQVLSSIDKISEHPSTQ